MQISNAKLDPLPPAIDATSVATRTAGASITHVRETLLSITNHLLWLDRTSTLWPPTTSTPYAISLPTLSTRLATGAFAPSPISELRADPEIVRKTVQQRKTPRQPRTRPLEDFEDVYYACLASVQELYERVRTRVNEGWVRLGEYITGEPDEGKGYLMASEVVAELEGYWGILNGVVLVKAMDRAVARGRVKAVHEDVLRRVHEGEIDRRSGVDMLGELYLQAESDEIEGLAWIHGWHPNMINAWLEEKYRITFAIEKERDAVGAEHEHYSVQEETEVLRLNERSICTNKALQYGASSPQKSPAYETFEVLLETAQQHRERADSTELRRHTVQAYSKYMSDELGVGIEVWASYGKGSARGVALDTESDQIVSSDLSV